MTRPAFNSFEENETITAAKLNGVFTVLENATTSLDASNFKTHAFDGENISKASVFPYVRFTKDTTSAAVTYTGNTFTDVSTIKITDNIDLQDGDMLVVHWTASVEEARANTPSETYFFSFRLYWDIGTGDEACPNSPISSYSAYGDTAASLIDQNEYINCGGSYCYIATGTVNIDNIVLYVKPGSNALDEVDITTGIISCMVFRR